MAGEVAHLLVIPFPAQGHMFALFDLLHSLSHRGVAITVVVTPKNLSLLSPLLSASPSIQPLLFPFPFPNYPSLPSATENLNGVSHAHTMPLVHALSLLQSDIAAWANSVANPPDAVLSDFLMGWTGQLAEELSIPHIVFSPSGASAIAFAHAVWCDVPEADSSSDVDTPLDFVTLPGSPSFPLSRVPGVLISHAKEDPLWRFVKEGFLRNVRSWGHVINTFDELEGVYLDHLRKDLGHGRVWAVGPLNLAGIGRGSVLDADLLSWLSAREAGSVIYVSFGTQTILSALQVEAVAAALERSGANFVWSVKEGPDAKIPKGFEKRVEGRGAVIREWAPQVEIPKGFEKRVEGRGAVIREWAPQVEILGHEAVGWFLTHCGWNSVMEGIGSGVAMLMWPMGADQFVNATLLEEMRIGIRVCEGQDTVPSSVELGQTISRVIVQDTEQRSMAARFMRKATLAVEEGNSSYRNVEGLVAALAELRSKREKY